MAEPTPCRLFVILARAAPVGVIFRRGPTSWVQLIRWDTATDTFTPGQWFHGRIYEQRADLSPDGRLLIYFAAKPPSGIPFGEGDYSYAWTAISRPPYFTALALWPKRYSGTHLGGGLFESNSKVWLNHPECEAIAHPNHQPQRRLKVIPRTFDPRYVGGYYCRLEREGWRVDREYWERWAPPGFVGAPRAWHEKAHPRYPYRLVMESSVFYREPPTFALRDDRRDELTPIHGATWADWDGAGRLVYAGEGKLFAATPNEQSAWEAVELADLNPNRPERLESPAWAQRW